MGWGEGMNNTNDRRLEAKSYIIHKHGGPDHHPASAVAKKVLIQDVLPGDLQAILIVRTKKTERASHMCLIYPQPSKRPEGLRKRAAADCQV